MQLWDFLPFIPICVQHNIWNQFFQILHEQEVKAQVKASSDIVNTVIKAFSWKEKHAYSICKITISFALEEENLICFNTE